MIKSNILKTTVSIAAIIVVTIGVVVLIPANDSNPDNAIIKDEAKAVQTITSVEENNTEYLSETNLATTMNLGEPGKYESGNKSGFIGYFDDKPLDNPIDNVFHVQIDRKLQGNETVWLEYELLGVEDYTGIAHSINDQLSVGGYLVKKSNEWKVQREQLNPTDVKSGDNVVRFTLPEGADYGFQIRNLSMYVEPYSEIVINNTKPERRLVVNQPTTEYYYGKLGYLQGYVIGDNNDKAEVFIDGEKIRYNRGTFESLIEKNIDKENWTVTVQAVFDDGQMLSVEVPFNKPTEWDEKNGFDKSIHHSEQIATKQKSFDIQLANARLKGEAGSVENDTRVSITALRDRDIPALDAGMVNVTAGYAGYRFLPHGTEFNKDIAVNLGYDTTKIPNGYGEHDIQTYFFDEVSHHWIAIQRDSVLLASNITQSRTNHFSDYINAIIKVPESPETQGYTPTSMKDVKAANPAAGMNLIAPPSANSMGNANLSYPIDIPAGRQGMQPQLAITYNSGGGNGWLGLGWDLSVPAISVDTRWGVPRYNPDKESETYTMGGEQLMPVAHRSSVLEDRTSDKQFFPRIEGSFSIIKRHGDSPKNYWWEITDKNGVKYYYGASSASKKVIPDAVLADSKGNIAQWSLVEERDLDDNFVKYDYAIQADKGVADPDATDGYQTYLKCVTYTGHGSENGKYSILFSRDRDMPDYKRRTDVIINARYGFKQVSADLLKRIVIKFNSETIRSYELNYEDGAFFKTLLTSITEKDSEGSVFNTHTFEYFDEVRNNGNYIPFEDENEFTVPPDTVTGDDLMSWAAVNATGGSKSKSWGLGSYIGVGWDNIVTSKGNSGGFDYDYDQGKNEGLMALVDIDGDGLDDRVFVKDGKLQYRRKLPENPETFSTNDEFVGGNVNAFQYSISKTNKFGVGVYPGTVAYIGGSKSITTTETSTYFTDANGDGLIDIVMDGRVYFNRIKDGKPYFDETPIGTPNEIFNNGQISSDLDFSTLTEDEVNELKQKNPLQDVVRMWYAQFDGRIKIEAPVRLINNPESKSNFPDGIIVSIQKNEKILWQKTISENDFSEIIPNPVDNITVKEGDRIYFRVHSIDNGYDDVVLWNQQITYLDKDTTFKDANNKPFYHYNASEDFLLSNNYTLSPPIHGIVNIESLFKKPGLTDSIGVSIIRYRNNKTVIDTLWNSLYDWQNDSIQEIGLTNIEVFKEDEIGFTIYSTSNVDWNKIEWNPYLYYTESKDASVTDVRSENGEYLLSTYPVVYHTVFPLKTKMGEVFNVPSIADSLRIQPFLSDEAGKETGSFKLIAIEANGDTLCRKVFELDKGKFKPDSTMTFACKSGSLINFMYTSFVNFEAKYLSDRLIINSDNKLFTKINHNIAETFKYNPKITVTAIGGTKKVVDPPFFFIEPKGQMWMVVKEQGAFLAKKKLSYQSGIDTLTFEATAGQKLYIEFNIEDTELNKYIKEYVNVNTSQVADSVKPFAFSKIINKDQYQFGNLYRGWGQFGYNGNDGRGNNAIDESKLSVDKDLNTEGKNDADDYKIDNVEGDDMDALEGNFESSGGYNASSAVFVLMRPDFEKYRWVGYDESVFITPDTISSSRMGGKEITTQSYSPEEGNYFFAPIKKNKSITLAGSGNVFGLGASGSTTDSKMLSDFMDMNGDRYPDIIAGGVVQYTNSYGGLSDMVKPIGNVSESEGSSYGLTAGGSIMKQVIQKVSKNHELNLIGNMQTGVSHSNSTNSDLFTYSDINGDGLPDKVYQNGKVELNFGYSFGGLEDWGYTGGIQNTSVTSTQGSGGFGGFGLDIDLETGEIKGGSVQFSTKSGSFSAGAGLYSSKSSPDLVMMDVNGDGLPDRLKYAKSGSKVEVYLNNGNGFANTPITWLGLDKISENVSLNGSFNVAATFGITFVVLPVKFVFNPRFNLARSVSRDEKMLTDYTGDGNLDYVVSHDKSQIKLRKSTIKRTNMLRRVNRPLGASFELDYKLKGNTYQMPQSAWTLSKVKIYDGHKGDGIDAMATSFDYSNGYQDRYERAFYGFGEVSTTQLDKDGKPYRTTVQTFANDNYFDKGLLLSETVQDKDDKKYVETINQYELKDRDMNKLAGGAEKLYSTIAFPALVKTTKKFYEGKDDAQKSTYTTFEYGSYGNVRKYVDYGDEGSDDDISAVIDYHELNDKNILSVPKSIAVIGNGKTLRQRSTLIDNATGKITKITQNAEGGDAVYDLYYNIYGSLDSIVRPANYKGERMYFAYSYDDVVHSYVTEVRDAFGYKSSSTYDYKFGQVLSTTDINGQQTKFKIDELGRITDITGPYELKSGQDYTIRFAYHPDAEIPWAHTQHFDPEHPDNPIETAIFIDGLGRVLQTKKDGAVFKGKGEEDTEVMLVSGKVEYDAFGRGISSKYPIVESKGSTGRFNTKVDGVKATTVEYDVLDRTVKTTLPDGAETKTEYGFGNDRGGDLQFMTRVTDANGISTESFADAKGQQTAVKAPEDTWTSFVYNAISELVEVKDAEDNITKSEYDMLGRRLKRIHPDAGTTIYTYDLAGNMLTQLTANLDSAKLPAIKYEYDYNRLIGITYPENAVNNVKFEYGKPGANHNRAGRIVLQEDATGAQEFFYGPLGEVTKNIRSVVVPGDDIYTFTTQWEYDTWNRLTKMVYPDGEELSYTYNTGGLLRSMSGKRLGHRYNYLTRLGYDKFENRVYLSYGNGTETTYDYEQDRRRLSHITAATSNGRKMMDNTYSYDKVNNILSLVNEAPQVTPNKKGGPFEYVYQYDDLYRLTHAEGDWKGATHEQRYELDMQYSPTGSILHKTQTHDCMSYDEPGTWVPKHKTTYDWEYKYEGSKPHAPSQIGENAYSYDANGNTTGWQSTKNNQRRNILWDEENRIRAIAENGTTHHYIYDASGERVIKATGDGQAIYINGFPMGGSGTVGNYTMYVNPFMVVSNSKYIKQFTITL